jgi:hypothetical protein
MVGLVAWAVAIGACFVVEGVALARTHDAWPTFSDIMRIVTASAWGRWALFAAWLWLGWHLFVRGWRFFLRAPAGGPSPGAARRALGLAPVAADELIREDVVPLSILYLLVVAMLVYCGRRIRRGGGDPRRVSVGAAGGWRPWLRHVLVTTGCGYALFLAVVLLYYGLVAGQTPEFLRDAVVGGAFLAFAVTVPAFAVMSRAVAWAGRR